MGDRKIQKKTGRDWRRLLRLEETERNSRRMDETGRDWRRLEVT